MNFCWCLLWFSLHASLLFAADASLLSKRDYSREVTLVTTIFFKKRSWLPPFKTQYYVHTALQFGAVGRERSLRVQLTAIPEVIRREAHLRTYTQKGGDSQDLLLSLFAREWQDDFRANDVHLSSVAARTYTSLGNVDYSNEQIMHPRQGTGLAWDAWKTDTTYRTGRTATGRFQIINDCNSFTQRLLRLMNVDLPEKTQKILDSSLKYALRSPDFKNIEITLGFYRRLGKRGGGGRLNAFHSIGNPNPPISQFFDPYQAPELGGSFYGDNPYVSGRLADIPEEPNRVSYDGPLDRAMKSDWGLEDEEPATQWDRNLCPRIKKRDLVARGCIPRSVFNDGDIFAVSSRIGGSLETLRVVATGVAEALGVAATVASAVFVIIDFVNHDWIGGSFALAGLVGGLAAAALVSGPAGWVLAAGVTAFFMILPGAFEKAAHPPRIDDKEQILRWATFGDSTHMGDEGCKEQHPGANCTMVYGAGVLSLVFQWDNFDSITFLAQYNDGWAMTLPEIANVFQILDPHDPGATAQAAAVIDCGTVPRMPSRWRLQQGNPQWCPKPKFILHRDRIMLPYINKTADEVYKRVIPHPGGDCLLVNEAAKQEYLPDYNITVLGGQAAIACNLSAGYSNGTGVIPLDSQGLPLDTQGHQTNATAILDQAASNLTASMSSSNDTSLNSTFSNNSNQILMDSPFGSSVSLGSTSTDNQAGHHIDPPPPSPFQNQLINATNAACVSSSISNPNSNPNSKSSSNPDPDLSNTLCLPTGTYSIQNITKTAKSLTMPLGASLSFTLTIPGHNGKHPLTVQKHYTENITNDNDFATSISSLLPPQTFSISIAPSSSLPNTTTTTTATEPPALCLFTSPHYLGAVTCLGPGGGSVPSTIKGQVESLKLYGGATAWVYAEYYGDVGGLRIGNGDGVPDLSGVTYGPEKGNWGGRMVAAWVLGP